MQYSIYKNSGDVSFVADINATERTPEAVKKRLAVIWGYKRGADLMNTDLRRADLTGLGLRGADLTGLDLTGAGLRGADLTEADLTGANLRWADLTEADLRWADLTEAELTEADLTEADLRGTILRGADLRGVDLREVDLTGADLTGAGLMVLKTDPWTCYIQKDHIRIGCQYHKAKDWFKFSDEEIKEMDDGAVDWWYRWKPMIQAIHETL